MSGYGQLNTLPVEVIDRILDVDLRGQVYGVKAVLPILPILREQRHGTIIGVSSGVGVRAVPLMIPYCIAKSGVNALYEGLRLEERHAKSNVRVTTILPASIDTPFYDSVPSWVGVRPAPIPPVYQPLAVAEAIVFAADHPRRDIYIGAAAQLAMLQRISPALTVAIVLLYATFFQAVAHNDHLAWWGLLAGAVHGMLGGIVVGAWPDLHPETCPTRSRRPACSTATTADTTWSSS